MEKWSLPLRRATAAHALVHCAMSPHARGSEKQRISEAAKSLDALCAALKELVADMTLKFSSSSSSSSPAAAATKHKEKLLTTAAAANATNNASQTNNSQQQQLADQEELQAEKLRAYAAVEPALIVAACLLLRDLYRDEKDLQDTASLFPPKHIIRKALQDRPDCGWDNLNLHSAGGGGLEAEQRWRQAALLYLAPSGSELAAQGEGHTGGNQQQQQLAHLVPWTASSKLGQTAAKCLGYIMQSFGKFEGALRWAAAAACARRGDGDAAAGMGNDDLQQMALMRASTVARSILLSLARTMPKADRQICYLSTWAIGCVVSWRGLGLESDTGRVWEVLQALQFSAEHKERTQWVYSETMEVTAIKALKAVLDAEPVVLTEAQNAQIWVPVILRRATSSLTKQGEQMNELSAGILDRHIDSVCTTVNAKTRSMCATLSQQSLIPFLKERIRTPGMLQKLNAEVADISGAADYLRQLLERIRFPEIIRCLHVWSHAFRLVGTEKKTVKLVNDFLAIAQAAFRLGLPDENCDFDLVQVAFDRVLDSRSADAIAAFSELVEGVSKVRGMTYAICWSAVISDFGRTNSFFNEKRLSLAAAAFGCLDDQAQMIEDERINEVEGAAATLEACEERIFEQGLDEFLRFCEELARSKSPHDGTPVIKSCFKTHILPKLDDWSGLELGERPRNFPFLFLRLLQSLALMGGPSLGDALGSAHYDSFIEYWKKIVLEVVESGDPSPSEAVSSLFRALAVQRFDSGQPVAAGELINFFAESRNLGTTGYERVLAVIVDGIREAVDLVQLASDPLLVAPNGGGRDSLGQTLLLYLLQRADGSSLEVISCAERLVERIVEVCGMNMSGLAAQTEDENRDSWAPVESLCNAMIQGAGLLTEEGRQLDGLFRIVAFFLDKVSALVESRSAQIDGALCPEIVTAENVDLEQWRPLRDALGFPKALEDVIVLPLQIAKAARLGKKDSWSEGLDAKVLAGMAGSIFRIVFGLRRFQSNLVDDFARLRGRQSFSQSASLRAQIFAPKLVAERLMVESSQAFANIGKVQTITSLSTALIIGEIVFAVSLATLARRQPENLPDSANSFEVFAQGSAELNQLLSSSLEPEESSPSSWFTPISSQFSTFLEGNRVFLNDQSSVDVFGQLCELSGRCVSRCAEVASELSSAGDLSAVRSRLVWMTTTRSVFRTIALLCGSATLPSLPLPDARGHSSEELVTIMLRSLFSRAESIEQVGGIRPGLDVVLREPIPFPLLSGAESRDESLTGPGDQLRDATTNMFVILCGGVSLALSKLGAVTVVSPAARAVIEDWTGGLVAALGSTDRNIQRFAVEFVRSQRLWQDFWQESIERVPRPLKRVVEELLERGELDVISRTERSQGEEDQQMRSTLVGGTESTSERKRKLHRERSADFEQIAAPRLANDILTPRQELKRMKLEEKSYVPPTHTRVDASQGFSPASPDHAAPKQEGGFARPPAASTPSASATNASSPATPASGTRLENTLRHALTLNFGQYSSADLVRLAGLCNELQGQMLGAIRR